jgi:adenine specific DNA methylase Mod
MTYDYNGNYLGIRDFNSNVKLFDNTYLSFEYNNNSNIITEYNANGESNFSVTLNNNSILNPLKNYMCIAHDHNILVEQIFF